MTSYKEALYNYYVSVMNNSNYKTENPEILEKRNAILKKLAEELSEQEAKEIATNDSVCYDYITSEGIIIEVDNRTPEQRKDEMATRALIYAAKLNDLRNKKLSKEEAEEGRKKKADDLNVIVDAYMGYDISDDVVIEVNGNTFNYKKGLDIQKYMDRLIAIGDNSTGQSYAVYLDEDGELVIY